MLLAASISVFSASAAVGRTPKATDVAASFQPAGVAISYPITPTPVTKRQKAQGVISTAVTATADADLDITIFRSASKRERAQRTYLRNLARATTDPSVLPLLAFASCGKIQVDVSDAQRVTNPTALAQEIQSALTQKYGPCPPPSAAYAQSAQNATHKVCTALFNAGILEIEAAIAQHEVEALGASSPQLADLWQQAAAAIGDDAHFPAALAALDQQCRTDSP